MSWGGKAGLGCELSWAPELGPCELQASEDFELGLRLGCGFGFFWATGLLKGRAVGSCELFCCRISRLL